MAPITLFLLFPLGVLLIIYDRDLPICFLFLLLRSTFCLKKICNDLLSTGSMGGGFLCVPCCFLFVGVGIVGNFFCLGERTNKA